MLNALVAQNRETIKQKTNPTKYLTNIRRPSQYPNLSIEGRVLFLRVQNEGAT